MCIFHTSITMDFLEVVFFHFEEELLANIFVMHELIPKFKTPIGTSLECLWMIGTSTMNQIEKILEVIGRPAPVIFLSSKIDLWIRSFFFFFFFPPILWYQKIDDFFFPKIEKLVEFTPKEKKIFQFFFPKYCCWKDNNFFQANLIMFSWPPLL